MMAVVGWARAEIARRLWKLGVYRPPDRYVLEDEILPALARDPSVTRVLFVGVGWFTKDYPGLVAGKAFATIDPDPAVARFGGAPHAVGRVQDLAHHFTGTTFDAIVLSGVIGWGLNDAVEVDRALAACAAALRPEGWLVLGVNELRATHVDPAATGASRAFEPRPFGPRAVSRIVVAVPFKDRTHTYLFWQKRATAP
jgi:SAM-dependent methyltransferase